MVEARHYRLPLRLFILGAWHDGVCLAGHGGSGRLPSAIWKQVEHCLHRPCRLLRAMGSLYSVG